jgi:hypothetical protein
MLRDDQKKGEGNAKLEKRRAEIPCSYHAYDAKSFLDNRTDKPKPAKIR